MTLCIACGSVTYNGRDFCDHHVRGEADNWAGGNRLLCDLLHRGVPIPRLPLAERLEESAPVEVDG